MCLAVPGRVARIYDENGLRMGDVDYGGTVSKVCLEYVPEIIIGQYTVVHAGFAISIIDEEEARRSLETWQEFLDLREKHGLGPLVIGPGEDEP